MNAADTAIRWASAVNTVTVGAVAPDGGTRGRTVTIGGARCIPWMAYEGSLGNRCALAVEVWDSGAEHWPEEVRKAYGGAMQDPAAWARRARDMGADLICLKMAGTHPDRGDRSAADAVAALQAVLAAVDLPLIVWGCGVPEKDNEVLPRLSEAAKGERCLFGTITDKNYRTLVASCLADGHLLLAESPLDVNIAKQINILAHDAGFPLEQIVIFPTTAAMGYGYDYVHSVMERIRTAGLGGDPLLRQPMLCDVGSETWQVKEAQASDAALPGYGPAAERGVLWETVTAANYLQAGADLLVLRHPRSLSAVRDILDRLTAGAKAPAA